MPSVDDRSLQNVWKNRQRHQKALQIAKLVADIMPRAPDDETQRVVLLSELWWKIAPKAVADAAKPVSVLRGVIHMVADDAAVRFEVQRELAPRLLESARERFPRWALRAVDVRLAGYGYGERQPPHK